MIRLLAALSLLASLTSEVGLAQNIPLMNFASGGEMSFEADSKATSRDGRQQIFEGNVIVIGKGTLIAADQIKIDHLNRQFTANGRVLILGTNQILAGDDLVYLMDSGDFKLSEALLITGNGTEGERVSNEIFGITPKEISYEQQRLARLSEASQKRKELMERYISLSASAKEARENIVEEFANLLQRMELIKSQKNPTLQSYSQARREAFERRRAYWKSLKDKKKGGEGVSFFRLNGMSLERKNGNDYYSKKVFWTPCYCEEDETPAWGFRASQAFFQDGGYVDLSHPVLEIKGIPILYVPYLKLPVKSQRQSGFLMPMITHEVDSGNVFSQPVYFALADDKDATLSMDLIEKRGTRLGIEYRQKIRTDSQIFLQFEGLRDKLWLDKKYERRRIVQQYSDALRAARQANAETELSLNGFEKSAVITMSDPDWWRGKKLEECLNETPSGDECFEENVKNRVLAPDNAWRSKLVFRAQNFFTPRLSAIADGEILSDHRYTQDVAFSRSVEEELQGRKVQTFSKLGGVVHLDAPDFYLGVNSKLGDYVRDVGRYEGHQLPSNLRLQTRHFMLGKLSSIPFYLNAMGDHKQITIDEDHLGRIRSETLDVLGEGSWDRAKVGLTSPLIKNSMINLEYFANLEGRWIAHAGLDTSRSTIDSGLMGLTFRMPLIGEGVRPEIWQNDEEEVKGQKMIRHNMDWSLTFSSRPYVNDSGTYRNLLNKISEDGERSGKNLAYFASDLPEWDSVRSKSEFADATESMFRHQSVIFNTSHSWDLFTRRWKNPEVTREDEELPEGFKENARYQLNRAYQAYTPGEGAIPEDSETIKPVKLSAGISYDFLRQEARDGAKEKNRNATEESEIITDEKLPEAWSPFKLTVNTAIKSWRLDIESEYNVYLKIAKSLSFGLTLPTIFSSTLGFGYTIGRTPTIDDESSELEFPRTYTRTVGLTTRLIPNIYAEIKLGKETPENAGKDGKKEEKYHSKLMVKYDSPSDCWGLNFIRAKADNVDEKSATYLLQLSVKLLGQQRNLTNAAPTIIKQQFIDEES